MSGDEPVGERQLHLGLDGLAVVAVGAHQGHPQGCGQSPEGERDPRCCLQAPWRPNMLGTVKNCK